MPRLDRETATAARLATDRESEWGPWRIESESEGLEVFPETLCAVEWSSEASW